ncbi:MAG: hypothetical protein JXB07_11135 [Anaerolineae bacterium]|nr:hypothetical protein [Anaerolineae bacterium]
MSEWDWIHRLVSEAYRDNDTARILMYEHFSQALDIGGEAPDKSLDLLDQSRMIARELGEKWWVQLINHWELNTLLYYKRDYSQVIEKAVKAVVEVRKPEYEHFPLRVYLHNDLVSAYLGIDPIGYREQIQAAIDYMESQPPPDINFHQVMLILKADFLCINGNFDLALKYAFAILEESEQGEHYLSSAYSVLCNIAFARRDWQKMKEWALPGEMAARRTHYESNLIELLAWNAVAARQLGADQEALRFFHAATQHLAAYGSEPHADSYKAMAAYHELSGDPAKACRIRERQLEVLEGKARYFAECQCRLEIVRLRKALGLPIEDAAAGAREAVSYLKDPSLMLKQLEDYLHVSSQ